MYGHFDVDSKELSRVLSCPAGAESTGLQAVDEINGWTYVMSNFQHPGDWESPLHDIVKATLDPLVRANYEDRFVIPTTHREASQDAYELRGNCGFSFGDGCMPEEQEDNLFGGVKLKNRKPKGSY